MANPEDNKEEMWVVAGALLVIASLTWYTWITYGHRITNASITATLVIMDVNASFHKILPDNKIVKQLVFLIIPEEFLYNKRDIQRILTNINPFKPAISDLKLVWTLLGYIVRVPIFLYAIMLSWKMYRMTRPLRMKRTFNIFSLARLNMANSPHIRHAIQKEIHKQPYNEGPHRQEEGCIRFAIIHGAIKYVDDDGIEFLVRLSNKHSIDNKRFIFYVQDSYDEDEGLPLIHRRCLLDVSALRIPLREQITHVGVWDGFDNMPKQAKALAAVFLYFIKGGKESKKKGLALVRRYNLSYKEKTKKKPWHVDDSNIDDIIREMENSNAVKNITKRHYYNVTALVGLYHRATARRTKLPPAVFYWIKEVDRGLWYALHQNLSPASWCEGAGVRSIEHVENQLSTPCSFPYVDGAVKGIVSYIDDEGWFLSFPENLMEISA
ncbi:MAG: hypothetical protein ACJAV1_002474 [Paraglaciecola sp.]|jgi:hypothetical protein